MQSPASQARIIEAQPHIFCTHWHRYAPNQAQHDHRVHGAPWINHGHVHIRMPAHFQRLIDDRMTRFPPVQIRHGDQTLTLTPRAAGARILHYMPDHPLRFDLSVEYVDDSGRVVLSEFHTEHLAGTEHRKHLAHKRRHEAKLPVTLT